MSQQLDLIGTEEAFGSSSQKIHFRGWFFPSSSKIKLCKNHHGNPLLSHLLHLTCMCSSATWTALLPIYYPGAMCQAKSDRKQEVLTAFPSSLKQARLTSPSPYRSTAATTKGKCKILLQAHLLGLGRQHTLPWYTSGGKYSFLGAAIACLVAKNATDNHITT